MTSTSTTTTASSASFGSFISGDAILVETRIVESDLFAHRLIDKKFWRDELEAFATKWFDYRQLTPVEATALYYEAYQKAFFRHMRKHGDVRRAEHIKLPDWIRFAQRFAEDGQIKATDKSSLSGYWRGRMVADLCGMPYEVYTDLAMEQRLTYWNTRIYSERKGRVISKTVPQPSQLYLEWVVEKVLERWEELQKARLYLSEQPAYLAVNYSGVQHQNDYHEWLFKQAGLRANPAYYLCDFVNRGQLPMLKIESRCDPDLVKRVREYLQ